MRHKKLRVASEVDETSESVENFEVEATSEVEAMSDTEEPSQANETPVTETPEESVVSEVEVMSETEDVSEVDQAPETGETPDAQETTEVEETPAPSEPPVPYSLGESEELSDFVAMFAESQCSGAAHISASMADSAGGVTKPALFEHPPPTDSSRIVYELDLPPVIENETLFLHFSIGLRDGVVFDDEQRQPRRC